MAKYSAIVKSVDGIEAILKDNIDMESPADIIADIMHWCDANSEDFDVLLQRASCYYLEDV